MKDYLNLRLPFYQKGGGYKDFLINPLNQPRLANESTAVSFVDPLIRRYVSTLRNGQSTEEMAATNRVLRNMHIQKEKKIKERKVATQAIDKGAPFTLPTGETKKYGDMSFREKAYVSGKALENRFRIFKNDDSILDDFNPANWIGSIAGNLGQAPLEAKMTNSVMPYVTSIGTPVLLGRAIGSNSLNPISKNFWTREVRDGQFFNNLFNPIPFNISRSGSKSLRNTLRPTNEQEVRGLKKLANDLSSYIEYKNLIKDGESWKLSLKDYKTSNPFIVDAETSLLTNLSRDGNTYISNSFPKKLTKYRDSELFYGTYPSKYNPYNTLNNEAIYRIDFQDYIHDPKFKTAEDILNAGKKDAYDYFNQNYKKYTPHITDVILRQNQSGGVTYTSDKNDPRLRAYNDSLSLYKKGLADEKKYIEMVNKLGINIPSRWSTSPPYYSDSKIKAILHKKVNSIGSIGGIAYGNNFYDLYENSNSGKSYNMPGVGIGTMGDTMINSNINQVAKGYDLYKKPVKRVLYRKEPVLRNIKPAKAELIKTPPHLFSTPLRLKDSGINVELGNIQNSPYQVDYFDPVLKQRTSKYFPSNVEGANFLKDLDPLVGLPEYRNRGDYETSAYYNKYQDGGIYPKVKTTIYKKTKRTRI